MDNGDSDSGPSVGSPDGIPAILFRGGTSKCWLFAAGDLPPSPADRDAFLARVFGSGEPRQIDGVGGGTSTTSKAIVVNPTPGEYGRIEYEFAQVSIDRAAVEWVSNCGNCASALALYALQAGLAPVRSPLTRVSLLNTRTGLLLDAEVDTPDGRPPTVGREVIPGTVYPGVRVRLTWRPLTWSTYGPTVSTGAPVDVLTVAGKPLRATLIDAGAPAAFVRADDLGLAELTDSAGEIDARLGVLFELRRAAAPLMAIPDVPGGFQSVPKVGIVGRSRTGDTDLEARMVSMTAAHPSVGITSAIALAAATAVRGSTVDAVLSARRRESGPGWHELSIGTLGGAVRIEVERSAAGEVTAVRCTRSARRLADARTHVPADWSGRRPAEPTMLTAT